MSFVFEFNYGSVLRVSPNDTLSADALRIGIRKIAMADKGCIFRAAGWVACGGGGVDRISCLIEIRDSNSA